MKTLRCAIYTRKSTDEGLEQDFNSLDAQRESAETYIASQKHEGWVCLPDHYDDGGYTGGNLDRPAVKQLMADIEAGLIDVVVVYKVDRLSRSLMDFARLMETFERHGVSFVSVTQQFNTTTPMGRLILNVLLSFAQFERELVSERTRDKIAMTRRRGKYSGGRPILGYDVEQKSGGPRLVVNQLEADRARQIFELYLEHKALLPLVDELKSRGWTGKRWVSRKGKAMGGRPFDKGTLYQMLTNPTYIGRVRYKTETFEGEHPAIVPQELWDKVQESLRSNGRSGGREVRGDVGALLRGILYCGHCQRLMGAKTTNKGTKRYRYYVCHKAQKEGWKACPSPSVPAAEVERFVVEKIGWITSDPKLIEETIAAYREQTAGGSQSRLDEQRRLTKELSRFHNEMAGLFSQERTDDVTARLAEIQDRIHAVERRLETLQFDTEPDAEIDEGQLVAALENFTPVWDELTPRERRDLVRALLDRVEFDAEQGSLRLSFRETGIRALNEVAA